MYMWVHGVLCSGLGYICMVHMYNCLFALWVHVVVMDNWV